MIGISIGSGEWLIGPAAAVRYGVAILGIVTMSVLLQAVFNIELMRYTVSTGEPITTGFMRLGNRPRMVGLIYIIFGFFHLGWPAFAAASAAALFAAINGRLPVDADAGSVTLYGYFTFLLALVILIFGKTVERTLERVSWVLMSLVFLFMIVVNVAFIPLDVWWSTIKGFGFVGRFPHKRRLDSCRSVRGVRGSGRRRQPDAVELGQGSRLWHGRERGRDRRRGGRQSDETEPDGPHVHDR